MVRADGVSTCTPSVECAPAWADAAAAVVDIYAVDMRLGAMGLCTGARFLFRLSPLDDSRARREENRLSRQPVALRTPLRH